MSEHNQPLPKGLPPTVARDIAHLDARGWGRRYRPASVARLGMGTWLHELRTRLEAIVGGAPGGVDMHAAHDTSLVALLCAIGAFDDLPIEYASYILFELAEDDLEGTFLVRVLRSSADLSLSPLAFGAPASQHGPEWVEWARFRSEVLQNATDPSELATVSAAVEAAPTTATANDTPVTNSAERSLQDVLTGSGRADVALVGRL